MICKRCKQEKENNIAYYCNVHLCNDCLMELQTKLISGDVY